MVACTLNLGASDAQTIQATLDLVGTLDHASQYAEIEKLLLQTMVSLKQKFGEDHEIVKPANQVLPNNPVNRGCDDEVISLNFRHLEPVNDPMSLYNLAKIYVLQNDYLKVETLFFFVC